MTSGRKKTAETVSCEQCGKTATWAGGRKRRFCSPNCAKKSKYVPRPRSGATKSNHKQLSDALKIQRGQCADCKMEINERTVIVIDWDHRDPNDKSFTIAQKLYRVSDELLIREIDKCDAVCANCHRYRTHDNAHHLNKREPRQTHPELFTT